MIAVDTSVWIDHLNDVLNAQVVELRDYIVNHRGIIVVGDIVMAEVLQGPGSNQEAARVETSLRRFAILPMARLRPHGPAYRIDRPLGLADFGCSH